MLKVQPVMIIPMPEKEWDDLSEETKCMLMKIEDRISEFVRYLYSDQPDLATELLKRIGLKDQTDCGYVGFTN